MYWITSLEGGPQKVNHAAVTIGDRIYSFGGYSSHEGFEFSLKIDVYVFNTNNFRWRPVMYKNSVEAPRKIYGHTVVAVGHKVYLFGGRTNFNACNTLFRFDTDSLMWNVVPTTGTAPRKTDGHVACVIDNYMYVFGGYDEEPEKFTNSLYRLNLQSFIWEKVETIGKPPSCRDFHTGSVIGNRMYIFGGRSTEDGVHITNEIYDNNIMYFDTSTMNWVKPICKGNIPCGRRSHSAAVYNNEIYIIGGFDGATKYHLNDIYKFNPGTETWFEMHPRGKSPCPRRRHCSCIVGDQLYLFGGSTPLDEELYASQYLSGINVEGTRDNTLVLFDHSDLFVLDFFPTLRRLAQLEIIRSSLSVNCLPQVLRQEVKILSKTNHQSDNQFFEYEQEQEDIYFTESVLS